MSIDLKVGQIDPPSIITDIINLPDPVKLGITITAYNYDGVGLYFKIDGYNAAWTFGTVNLGLIGAGGNLQQNLDQFGSRARPAAETAETITLRLRAYTDAGYLNLKWTYLKTLDVLFIKSDDGSWIQDFLNNFDDGTVQGWAVANESGNDAGFPTIGVANDFVLSPPWSCKMTQRAAGINLNLRARLWKLFNTPNRSTVLALIDIRNSRAANLYVKYIQIQLDGTVNVYLGKPWDTAVSDYLPIDRWTRIVVPLPGNSAVTIRIVHCLLTKAATIDAQLWLDDFKIISK